MSADVHSATASPSDIPEDHVPVQTPSPASSASTNTQTRPFNSRVITPALTSSLTSKAAVATASTQPSENAQPSPLGSGPTSASYVVPPRPKPGRKPATDEPASKRKAQNRESQRAFRARKAAKLNEMQAQVESAEQRYTRELGEKSMEISQLQAALAKTAESEKRYMQERDYWKDQTTSLQQQIEQLNRQARERDANSWSEKQIRFPHDRIETTRQDSPARDSISLLTPLIGTPQSYQTSKIDLGCGDCKDNGECPCIDELAKLPTPKSYVPALPLHNVTGKDPSSPTKGVRAGDTPSSDSASNFADREIDFTAQFSNKRPRLDKRPSITFLTQSNDQDSNCGFCTDDANCLCKDEELRKTITSDEMRPPPRDWNNTALNESSSSDCPNTGPGTCSDCMANPRQRAWCQRISKMKKSGALDMFTSRYLSVGSVLDAVDPRNDNAPVPDMNRSKRYSIGCSDAFRLFEGRLSVDDNMDWVNNLRPVSPIARRDTIQLSRTYSALELDTASVIATLQQSMVPLTPRPSDGPNAELIKVANEKRKKSDSPMTPRLNGLPVSQTTEMRQTQSGSPGLPISTLINGTSSLPTWR